MLNQSRCKAAFFKSILGLVIKIAIAPGAKFQKTDIKRQYFPSSKKNSKCMKLPMFANLLKS